MTTPPPDYSGMTTNERLYVAGVLDAYNDAARRRDGEAMVSILMRVDFDQAEAESITRTVLASPERYGFSITALESSASRDGFRH